MQFKKHNSVLLLFALMAMFSQTAFAQRRDRERERERERERPREEEKETPKGFTSRLWYGGGVNIGFGGYNGGSIFVIGVSPMVGYRIVGPLSAGPRVAYDFASLKEPNAKAVGLHSVDVGVFVRCRVFQGLFVQGELSNKWFQGKYVGIPEKFNDQRVNQRFGAGWNFGEPGGTGTEISVLYNFRLAQDIEAYENPIEYRFGLTWKF
ncbi:MAG: hypothetical protein H7246_13105 [Phycisphaerae bacterium]|nr:hypothetical protein [Saprospiraceae bacterium]